MLKRTRGGAQSLTQPGQVSVFDARLRTNLPVKAAIGARAAALVEPGDTILLDSGTTVLEVPVISPESLINDRGLRSSHARSPSRRSSASARASGCSCWAACISTSSIPSSASRWSRRCATCTSACLFIGTDGISAARGLTTDNTLEASLYRTMVGIADRVIVVADAGKIGVEKLQATVPLEDIHTFVTDEAAPVEFINLLRSRGVDVLTAAKR